VILAGGVINSPHLLMLSGIGDPEMLRQHAIETRIERRGVGRNLQDHLSVLADYRRREPGPFVAKMRLVATRSFDQPFSSNYHSINLRREMRKSLCR
jgi:choline dehydrogenase-like flavoprotein